MEQIWSRSNSLRIICASTTTNNKPTSKSYCSSRLSSAMFSMRFVLSFTLFLSLPLLFLFAPQILLPQNLPISMSDELDDLALFHRAASSATRRHLPPTPPPSAKIAFLFLTNTDLYFAPLWELFFHDNEGLFNIYIHADPNLHIQLPGGVFSNRSISGKRTHRASATLISATRRLLATALLDDPSNYFFALLSQYCIPLHSFRFIYHSLFTSDSPSSSLEDLKTPHKQRHGYYRSFIEILENEPRMWARYTARGNDVMMPEVPFTSFRVGSQFFILTRSHALLVIRDRRLWSKFMLPCRNTDSCYPEEHYIPTLLSMEDPDGCRPFTRTHVNWTATANGHPHTYGPSELSVELIHRLRVSKYSDFSYFFARKFTPDCLAPLLKMVSTALFRD